mmetsp:Transcript_9699/g.34084  ORF Transcript_9699/g.34084 Transcript_9699/m.34084 type:complete len:164 (-) Transcript_9699:47-538(-)
MSISWSGSADRRPRRGFRGAHPVEWERVDVLHSHEPRRRLVHHLEALVHARHDLDGHSADDADWVEQRAGRRAWAPSTEQQPRPRAVAKRPSRSDVSTGGVARRGGCVGRRTPVHAAASFSKAGSDSSASFRSVGVWNFCTDAPFPIATGWITSVYTILRAGT